MGKYKKKNVYQYYCLHGREDYIKLSANIYTKCSQAFGEHAKLTSVSSVECTLK